MFRERIGLCRRREGDADELLPVMHIDATIGVGGLAPDDVTATSVLARIQQFGAIDLFVTFGCESREDQFTLIIPDEDFVVMFHQESRGEKPGLADRVAVLPKAIAGFGIEAT